MSARRRGARRRRPHRPRSTPRPPAALRYSRRRGARRCWRERSPRAVARPPAGTAAAPVSVLHLPSSLHLPRRTAVLVILELDPHCVELAADAISLLEVFFSARDIARLDQRVNAAGVSNHL